MEGKMKRKLCAVVGCKNEVHAKDLCSTHYMRVVRHGDVAHTRPADWGLRHKHPLWDSWKGHGRAGQLCHEWRTDFWRMVADVGERPKDHHLDREDGSKPYGPGNWFWRELKF